MKDDAYTDKDTSSLTEEELNILNDNIVYMKYAVNIFGLVEIIEVKR